MCEHCGDTGRCVVCGHDHGLKYIIKRKEQRGGAKYNQRYYRHTVGSTVHWTHLVWEAAQFDSVRAARASSGYSWQVEIVPVETVRGETREVIAV